jgi:hypothetical protein
MSSGENDDRRLHELASDDIRSADTMSFFSDFVSAEIMSVIF